MLVERRIYMDGEIDTLVSLCSGGVLMPSAEGEVILVAVNFFLPADLAYVSSLA